MGGYAITAADWEELWLHDNGEGVADVHQQHVPRVAQILSERYPGIVFLWDKPTKQGICTITAIRHDRRAMSSKQAEAIVAAAEKVAAGVTNKYPVKRRGLIARLFFGAKAIRPGWHYTEKSV